MMDLYQYNYVEYDGFQSTTYAISLVANKVTIKSGKGVGKYEFKYDGNKKRLSLYGDNSVLCDIDEFLAVKSVDKFSIVDTEDGDRCIRICMTLLDGTKERMDFPLSELINLYKSGLGIEIDEKTGEINISVSDGGHLKFDSDKRLYVDLKGGNGIDIDDNGFINFEGGTAYSGYTKEEVDEIADGIEAIIEEMSGSTLEAISGISEDIEALREAVETNTESINGLDAELDEVVSGLTETGETISWILGKIEEHDSEISGLTVSAETAQEAIIGIMEGLATTGETIDGIIEDIKELDTDVTEMMGSIDALKAFSGETAARLDEVEDEIDDKCNEVLGKATGYTHEWVDRFSEEYTLQSRTDEIKAETDKLISETSGKTLEDANAYTDGVKAVIEDSLKEYAKKTEVDEEYAKKSDLESGIAAVKTECESSVAESQEYVLGQLTEHTAAMKNTIKEKYVQKGDADEKYLTKDDAAGMYETIQKHEDSFSGFTSVKDFNELKDGVVNENTCAVNHIYELIGAGKDTKVGEFILVKYEEFEALKKVVTELESRVKMLEGE